MSRVRWLVLFVCAFGIAIWLTQRSHPAANAAPLAEYGDNTEENAMHRWEQSKARHWRHVVTRR